MPTIASDYSPSFFFQNQHINTIYSSLFRRLNPLQFKRRRIETLDDDFLDIDFLENGERKIVILCHGLEGSSASKYIQATAKILHENGYAIAAMNYRFCSGEINRQLVTYHSGRTEDLNAVIEEVLPHYDAVYLVGFSLGGNLVLKYTGEGIYKVHPKVKATLAISVPVDLYGSSLELQKIKNRIYTWRFLITLSKKVKLKHVQYPDRVDVKQLKRVKKLIDFDEYFTSTLNGFRDAKDYYAQANCKQFLHNIKIPSLLINALDDPFLSASCYPYEEAESNPYFNLMTPKYGGHVGFVSSNQEYYWVERQILAFIENN
jgi:uncharacterized protein